MGKSLCIATSQNYIIWNLKKVVNIIHDMIKGILASTLTFIFKNP